MEKFLPKKGKLKEILEFLRGKSGEKGGDFRALSYSLKCI
jgi:hypothetical protein